MNLIKRILFFFLLPAIAWLVFPLDLLRLALPIIVIAVIFFAGLGLLLWTGRSLALTLAIFLQGLNVIIRLLMFFPNAVSTTGQVQVEFALALIVGLLISFYLMLRLDRLDVRMTMIR